MNDRIKPPTMDQQAEVRKDAKAGGSENVEAIRDILFGRQMRDYDGRFVRLEETIRMSSEKISSDINAHLDNIRKYVREELDALAKRLEAERRQRSQDTDNQTAAVTDLKLLVEDRLEDINERATNETQALRNSMHEQSSELIELVRATRDQLSNELKNESDALRSTKLARQDLAELLSEVSMRLKEEFDLPSA